MGLTRARDTWRGVQPSGRPSRKGRLDPGPGLPQANLGCSPTEGTVLGESAAESWVDDLERLEAVAYDKTPGPATCSGCKHLSDTAFCSVTRGHRYARQARCDKYERREGYRDKGGEAIIDF